MRMSVKGHLALLGVALVQWDLAGGAARDLIRTDAPKIRAARELRASHLAERRALAARRVGPWSPTSSGSTRPASPSCTS
jgi:hypothetical protein